MTSRVIVFGSINLDLVAGVEKISSPGETVSGHSFETFPGGKGANQAMAAHRADGEVTLFGKVGDDAAGRQLLEFYQSNDLSTDNILTTTAHPTGTALIQVEQDSGENSIVVVPGANAEFTNAEIDSIDIAAGDVLVSQFEVPQSAIERLFRRARACGAKTILNPAPASDMHFTLLDVVDVLVVNETELSFFAGQSLSDSSSNDDIAAIARELTVSNQQVILVTLGKRGCLAVVGDQIISVPGRDVKAIDATGAGDCFVGSLGMKLSQGSALEEALNFANVAASISVQREGAGPSMPLAEEILSILEDV